MGIVIGIIVGLLIGAVAAWYVTGKMANSKAQNILSDAEKDAEVIKKNKLLEAKEEALTLKAELEKQANQRSSRLQVSENRLKQREMSLTQHPARLWQLYGSPACRAYRPQPENRRQHGDCCQQQCGLQAGQNTA